MHFVFLYTEYERVKKNPFALSNEECSLFLLDKMLVHLRAYTPMGGKKLSRGHVQDLNSLPLTCSFWIAKLVGVAEFGEVTVLHEPS